MTSTHNINNNKTHLTFWNDVLNDYDLETKILGCSKFYVAIWKQFHEALQFYKTGQGKFKIHWLVQQRVDYRKVQGDFNKPLLSDNILNIWVDENQCSAKLIVVKRLLPISHEMLGLTTEVEK